MLYVARSGFCADLLREAAAAVEQPGTLTGASLLPNGLGAWLKVP